MRNGIRITNTTYKVDKENKVVVCELKCDLQFEKHPAWEVIRPSMWEKQFPNISWDGVFTVRAKARCNNLDNFDEKNGKMIAESRAKAKMFRRAGRLYLCCKRALENASDSCLATATACVGAIKVEENHIEELAK